MFDKKKIKKIESLFNAKHHCINADWHTFIGKGLLPRHHIAYDINLRTGQVNKYSFRDGSPVLFTESISLNTEEIVKKICKTESIYGIN